jgi:hypothetical protein
MSSNNEKCKKEEGKTCKRNSCSKEKDTKANLAETASLGRDKATDENQEGYNFMGTLHNWTSNEEQERKVKEIEKVTKEEVGHVKEAENNNHGQWTKK